MTSWVRRSLEELESRRIEFFAESLPASELWRLYSRFEGSTAFVDIETTGLSPYADEITVIGLYDGKRSHEFVRGIDLHRFPESASRYDLFVTYNGSTFDMNFLRREFPRFRPKAHIDLRWPLAKLGLRGGLKEIERRVGLRRPAAIQELSGFEAVILWHEYKAGRTSSLERLKEYCRQDTVSLAPLAELVSRRMPGHLGFPGSNRLR